MQADQSRKQQDRSEYVWDRIVGAKQQGKDVVYLLKWNPHADWDNADDICTYEPLSEEEFIDPQSGLVLLQAELEGQEIELYWSGCGWQAGEISEFDHKTGKHLIKYDDGDSEVVNLTTPKRKWQLRPFKEKRVN